MPGNEAPEHIHNFFEQDNSSQGHQSQVGGGSWPYLNNPWVGTQMQNGIPPYLNNSSQGHHSLDSERGNGMQSIRTPFGTNPTQSVVKPELIRGQHRTPQINLNGYVHGSQGFQAMPIQSDFQGDGTISDTQHNLANRSFSSFEAQQNAPMYSSGLRKNLEREEATGAPVGFDFLGGQQIIKNQHPELEQSHSRQQQGISEMHLWQQQLLFKQLQEMQRQPQLQQLQERGRHHNSLGQFSGIAGQGTNDQLPGLLSGMPINDASNYMRTNELLGGELKLPSSSHMMHSANMTRTQRSGSSIQGIPNGLTLSHDQGQVIRAMGLVPQQPHQSLYGNLVSSRRDSQFLGTDHEFTSANMVAKAGGNLAEKALMHSSAFNYVQGDQYAVSDEGYLHNGVSLTKQGIQGQNVVGNAPVQSESGGATSGSFHQGNHFSPSVQAQEVEQVGPSQGVTSLDPIGEKLLFSADDGNLGNLFGGSNGSGTEGFLHENPSQSNDYLSSFPSIQSGSWSALMQEAVEASSSDTGLIEEWSGLSFHKTALSPGNCSSVLNANNGKQHAPWSDGNHQNASSLNSRSFPLFNDAEGSPNCHVTPTLQTLNFSYQQGGGVPSNAFNESFQQCVKEPNDTSFHQQKQYAEDSVQMQQQVDNISDGVWAGRMLEKPASSVHSADFNPQNMHRSWAQQQKIPLHSVSRHPINKPSGWNVEALASSGGNASKPNYNDEKEQHSVNMEREHEGRMWNYTGSRVTASYSNSAGGRERVESDTGSPMIHNEHSYTGNLASIMDSNNLKLNQETDQKLLSRQQSGCGKQVADTFLKNKTEKYRNQPTRSPQVWGSSIVNVDRTTTETLHKQESSHPKELPNEGFNPSYLISRHNAERGGFTGKSSFLSGNGPHTLVNSSLMPGQESRENLGPRRFPFYQMGNLEMSMEPKDSQNNTSNSQDSQLGVIGKKNQEQEYPGRTHFACHAANSHAANSDVDMVKGYSTDLKGNARAAEEIQSRSAFHKQSLMPSTEGAASQFAQNKQSGVTSENMLELLHKVDQSRAGNTGESFGFSARNAPSEMPDADVSAGRASHQQHNRFALQGISLKMAPPSQRHSLADCALPLQTSLQHTTNDFDQRNSDSGQSMPPGHKASLGDESLIPGNRSHESMNSNSQGNLLAAAAYNHHMNQFLMQQQKQEQKQQQQISSATGPTPNNQSANHSVSEVDAASKQPFHTGKGHKSYMGAIDQSVASQFYPVTTGHPQPTISSMHPKSSRQQNSSLEMRITAQSSGKSAMPQQGGFSGMLHNVWTSVSSQRHVSGMQPQKIISNVLESSCPLPSSRETNSQAPQKAENHGQRKGESALSKQGEDCIVKDTSSQEMPPPERVSIEPKNVSSSRGQEADPKPPLSLSSSGPSHQQDHGRGKHSQDSSRDTHGLGTSDVQKQNYSLLQQMQAMKDGDSDLSNRPVKRLKGADIGSHNILREMGATSHNISNSSDVRMMSFTSRENEGKDAKTSVQDNAKEAPSQDHVINKDHDIHSHTLPHTKTSPVTFVGGNIRPQISPQMAPSWFEQYGNLKNGQISTPINVVESLQRSAKAAGQHHFFSKFSESMNQVIGPEQRNDASQVVSLQNDTSPILQHDTSLTPVGANQSLASSHHPPLEVTSNNIVLLPKKRKSATEDLLPWHKEVTEGCQRLQSISAAEREWARATNRLIDKVEDEFGIMEDSFAISRSRRRLIVTNQLMQQILPSVPSTYLKADVTASCESITYFCAKLTLRDACSQLSQSRGDSRLDFDSDNMGSGKFKSSEKKGANHWAKAAEDFIGRSRELENDFLSMDRRASILDLRLECQELERSSIMNRFAKFHGRAQIEEAGSTSTSEIVPRRTYPQRHVTASALRTNLPEGANCLSL